MWTCTYPTPMGKRGFTLDTESADGLFLVSILEEMREHRLKVEAEAKAKPPAKPVDLAGFLDAMGL